MKTKTKTVREFTPEELVTVPVGLLTELFAGGNRTCSWVSTDDFLRDIGLHHDQMLRLARGALDSEQDHETISNAVFYLHHQLEQGQKLVEWLENSPLAVPDGSEGTDAPPQSDVRSREGSNGEEQATPRSPQVAAP